VQNKTKDNLIYLGVAGALVTAIIFYIFYNDRARGTIPQIPEPILWGILSTPAMVALILERFWRHRGRRMLWTISVITASSNIVLVAVAYSRHWNPPVLLLSTMTGLWLIVVFVVTEKLLSWEGSSRKSSK